jgi:hypothetical protein
MFVPKREKVLGRTYGAFYFKYLGLCFEAAMHFYVQVTLVPISTTLQLSDTREFLHVYFILNY